MRSLGSGRALASGSLQTAAFENCGQPPCFTDGETEDSPGTLALLGFPPAVRPVCGRRLLRGWWTFLAQQGCLGGRARPAESASPATFAGVAWSPGECASLTKLPVSRTTLREVGGELWRQNHSASFSPSEASVSPSVK